MAEQKTEKKQKYPIWFYPATLDKISKHISLSNSKSRSEFVEKACEFYCGFLTAESSMEFLPTVLTSAMAGTMELSEERLARLLFKLAVELSIGMHIITDYMELPESYLRKLRADCVDKVKQSTGSLSFEALARDYKQRTEL